ncbi:protein Brevis radix-like 1 isoform X2 [Phalaenopsis equestris]|uniref:protein Brevis radix-like 1 isoform X2 n=1 Tax=Phalaenopsis equestris TaxID=78828 RepID=UPI0009E5FB8C|nr:protein Brevis radix-like 1 isoform X2 [Phalaenopsis equestris]
MLTCIACTKQLGSGSLHESDENDDAIAGTPSTRQAIKALTSQVKDMALKASGAYRHCKPCAPGRRYEESSISASGSERFLYSYRRACAGSRSTGSTPILLGLSSGEGSPLARGRTQSVAAVVASFMDEEPREWVAQVEPGVLITFFPLPQGGNDLKRIRFSREMFNKRQAQQWWGENYDKVMELYNVQGFNRQVVALPTPPHSEDKMDSIEDNLVTPPLSKERFPHNFHQPMSHSIAACMLYSSSDSLEHHSASCHHHSQHLLHHHCERHCYGSGVLASTPKLSSMSGAKTETSSMDASVRTCSSPDDADRSGELSSSVSNASDLEREWIEEDVPGVYITIRAFPNGIRELRRVRFSRERFSEMHARLWWEQNRRRIHEQYL